MTRKKLIDFVERVGSTFVVSFVGVYMATGANDLATLKAAGIAGALSAGKFAAVAAQKFLDSTPTE